MGRPTFSSQFLIALNNLDGRASNPSLRAVLGWSEDRYWRVHSELLDEGVIEKGKGKGGTVILVEQELQIEVMSQKNCIEVIPSEVIQELQLYAPCRVQLEKSWSKSNNFDSCHVEIVAQQGSKNTGGSWSRPDLAIVGLRNYEYIPNKFLEIHTFEVKPEYDVSVKGVMEALTHREFATKSFVIYHTNGREIEEFSEFKRIEMIAGRHGVGVFSAPDINNFDTWTEKVSAVRVIPDPEEMELFIKRSLSEATKSKILKWQK